MLLSNIRWPQINIARNAPVRPLIHSFLIALFALRYAALVLLFREAASGYNSVFPENLLIGFIDDFGPENASFYDIDVKLSNDFSNLAFVYVIKNSLKEERIELETAIQQGSE